MRKRVQVPIYGQWLFMFDSVGEAADWVQKNGGTPVSPDGSVLLVSDLPTGAASHAGNGNHLIAVDANETLAVVMHEAIHVSWEVLDFAGVQIDCHNHEAQTYLAQWVFETFCEKLRGLSMKPSK